jgi:hypothetical protein
MPYCVNTEMKRALKNEWIICERDRWRFRAVGQKLQEAKVKNLVFRTARRFKSYTSHPNAPLGFNTVQLVIYKLVFRTARRFKSYTLHPNAPLSFNSFQPVVHKPLVRNIFYDSSFV